jgi:hypothetical protein
MPSPEFPIVWHRSIAQSAPQLIPTVPLPRKAPGHQPGFSAISETRHGILQYLPDEPLVGDSLGWYGEYLQGQLKMLERLLRLGAAVLEVGPGVGFHALSLSAAIGPTGHLMLAEPRQHRILRQNLAANRVANVTLLTSTFGNEGESTRVETVDGLQLESLDCLKLNEGGAAPAILEGAAETLWRLRPMVFIAAVDQPRQGELARILNGYGYRVWRMATPLFDLKISSSSDDDIFRVASPHRWRYRRRSRPMFQSPAVELAESRFARANVPQQSCFRSRLASVGTSEQDSVERGQTTASPALGRTKVNAPARAFDGIASRALACVRRLRRAGRTVLLFARAGIPSTQPISRGQDECLPPRPYRRGRSSSPARAVLPLTDISPWQKHQKRRRAPNAPTHKAW